MYKRNKGTLSFINFKNGTAIRTRHTGSVKAEKNTFTKDGKKIPEEKAVDIR